MTEDEYAAALHAELAYMKAQPNVTKERLAAIENEIQRVSPQDEAAPELEAAVVEAPETAVTEKPKRRRAKADG